MAIDKLSKFNIGKGIVGGHRFAVWDYIGPCQGDECVIHDVCTYKDAKPTSDRQTKKCGIERYYMSVVFKPFADLVDKLKDPFVMQWVGLHIIPLYHQLIKLKKFERSLASPIDISSKGDARIHPVLKEIRAVIADYKALITGQDEPEPITEKEPGPEEPAMVIHNGVLQPEEKSPLNAELWDKHLKKQYDQDEAMAGGKVNIPDNLGAILKPDIPESKEPNCGHIFRKVLEIHKGGNIHVNICNICGWRETVG